MLEAVSIRVHNSVEEEVRLRFSAPISCGISTYR
jgi:hypothetical protein